MVCNKCKVDKPKTEEYFRIAVKNKSRLRKECKECERKISRKWFQSHPEYSENWYQNNKEKHNKKSQQNYSENIDRIKEKHEKYWMKCYNNNPLFKIRCNLSKEINYALKKQKKYGKTMELVGCSINELKKYLERQFQYGMNWENYGFYGWHVDHIKPCCKFDLSKEEEQKRCFHYTNLQPLWARDNIRKGGKYAE